MKNIMQKIGNSTNFSIITGLTAFLMGTGCASTLRVEELPNGKDLIYMNPKNEQPRPKGRGINK